MPARSSSSSPTSFMVGVGVALAWGVLLIPPFVVVPTAADPFRLPKLLASECLGLASLVCLSWRLREVGAVRPRTLIRIPILQALLPLVAVASLGWFTTSHPCHVREGLVDLWIGALCLAGWSLALEPKRLEGLLSGLLWPATALALLGILQFHGLYRPFAFAGGEEAQRLGVTSFAGNAGDLGAYLVLPCLVAQWRLWKGQGRRRGVAGIALVLSAYALVVTQTLAAIVTLFVASLLLWSVLLPGRKRLAAGGILILLLTGVGMAVEPLRIRLVQKGKELARGEVNQILTGRLDGWRAALWMLGKDPWTGVGVGAYRAEFAAAKLALLDQGVSFYPGHAQAFFANAHNEYLEAGAEMGIPGLLALGWGIWVLLAQLRRWRGSQEGWRGNPELALAASGIIALGLLALVHFPFRIALVGYPWLVFLAWVWAEGGRNE